MSYNYKTFLRLRQLPGRKAFKKARWKKRNQRRWNRIRKNLHQAYVDYGADGHEDD